MSGNGSVPTDEPKTHWQTWRLLIIGFVAVIILMGLVFVVATITNSSQPAGEEEKVNALANSNDECVVCHRRTTPGIVEQYGVSTMAVAEVDCVDCHEVEEGYRAAWSTRAFTSSPHPQRPCVIAVTPPRWPNITRAVMVCRPSWPTPEPSR